MTTFKTLIGAVALIAASTGFAQSSNTCSWFPKGEDGQGVIGKRYAEAGVELQDLNHDSKNAYATNIGANVPIIKGLDLSGGYAYGWYDHSPMHQTDHAIGSSIKLYNEIEKGIKPFIAAGLGYSWLDEKLDSGWYFFGSGKNKYSQDKATWDASVGAEFSFKWLSVTPRISYNDDFERSLKSEETWQYGVEANAWITRRIGIYAQVAYVDWQHTTFHSWKYGTGIRVRF
jgi:hypothetical protein